MTKEKKQLCVFSVEATLPLRGVLALGIVLHHISQRVLQVVPTAWGISQFEFWGAPVVAVFFFLSGYGLMKSLQVKGAAYLDGFLKKRMLKVVLPLLLCSLVYSVVNISILGGQFASVKSDWPFLPNAWFCVTIIIYYFVFYLIALCSKSKQFRLLVWMWLFTFVYIGCLKAIGFGNWWYQTVVSLNMGMTTVLLEKHIRMLLVGNLRLVSCILFLFVCILSFWVSTENLTSFPLGWLTLSVFIGIFIYSLLCGFGLATNKILRFLGRYSYEIYLIHGAIVSVVFGMAYTYITNWWMVMMIFILFSTFAFALILKRVMSIILSIVKW